VKTSQFEYSAKLVQYIYIGEGQNEFSKCTEVDSCAQLNLLFFSDKKDGDHAHEFHSLKIRITA
jgi:hypothetical protein